MSTIANLTVALNADVGGFVGATKTVAQQTRAMGKLASDAFKATRTDAERYEIAIRKISDAYALGKVSLEVYQRSVNQLHDEYHGVAEAAAQAQRAQAEMAAAGARVARQVRTPLEAYKAELVELRRLLRGSAIDQETFNRARRSGLQAVRNTGPRADIRAQGAAVFNSTRTAAERYAAEIQRLDRLLQANAINLVTHRRAVLQARNAYQAATTANAGGGNGIGSQLAGGLLGFSTGVGATIVAANMAINAVKSLGNTVVDTGVKAITLAADFEKAEVAFTTLFKSAETAKQVMAEIKSFAALTPFEFPEIKDATVKLAGFGIQAKELVPTLQLLGDLSAGTGTSIGELAETYGKARIQGRAYTRDVNEFANRGVPIWEALNRVMGTNNVETHKLVEDGKVGFGELQKALISLVSAGGMFEGGLKAQSQTLHGLYSTLKDNITLTLAEIGESISKELDLKSVTQDAIELTAVFKNELTPVVIEFAKGMAALSGGTPGIARVVLGIDTMRASILAAHEALLRWKIASAGIFGGGGAPELITKYTLELMQLEKMRQGGAGASGKLPSIEAGGTKDVIAEEIAALQREADLIGKSNAEKQLAALFAKGLTEAYAEEVFALLEKLDADKAAQAAEERTRSTMESHIAALKLQADTFGMTAKQADLYKQSLAGANDEQLRQIAARHDDIEALQDEQKQMEELRRNMKDRNQEIDRIKERNETPQEKFEREMKHLEGLKGGLDDETFARESGRLARERDEALGRGQQKSPGGAGGALVAGTSGFYSAIARTLSGQQVKAPPGSKEEKQMLQVQRRQEVILRNLEKKRPKILNFVN